MAPISIRLATFEVKAILDILEDACRKCVSKNVRIETIVLAEFYIHWWRRHLSCYTKKKTKKDPLYSVPLSVAKILHHRLQHLPNTQTHQFILAKLDQELLNRNQRPDFPISIT